MVDIEREVELGGPIHSKGVLILSGFLGARYGRERPLALRASLVFEQSYGGVEGDSASLAELYALLSALAELPLSQSLAVTGSVNQHGQIQAIGGVNEKIEGFFDVCTARGLTGDAGRAHPGGERRSTSCCGATWWPRRGGPLPGLRGRDGRRGASSCSPALPAGERGADGFPGPSVNGRVEARLAAWPNRVARFLAPSSRGAAGGCPGSGRTLPRPRTFTAQNPPRRSSRGYNCPMGRVGASLELPFPAAPVFRVATRIEDLPKWLPEVVAATLLDAPLAPGSRVRLKLSGRRGDRGHRDGPPAAVAVAARDRRLRRPARHRGPGASRPARRGHDPDLARDRHFDVATARVHRARGGAADQRRAARGPRALPRARGGGARRGRGQAAGAATE